MVSYQEFFLHCFAFIKFFSINIYAFVYRDSCHNKSIDIYIYLYQYNYILNLVLAHISEDVLAKVSMKFQTVERRGRKLMYFPTMTTKLTIKDYTATFMPGNEANPVAQAINSVLVTSRQEIIVSMTPNLEKAISTKVLEVSNRICKHFTYDELFPDTA